MSNSSDSDGEKNVWNKEKERARLEEERRQYHENIKLIENYLKEIRRDRDWRLAQDQDYSYNSNYHKKIVDHLRYIREDQYLDHSKNHKYENLQSLVDSLEQKESDNFEFPKRIISRVAFDIKYGKLSNEDYGFESTDEEEEALEDDMEEEALEDDVEEEAPEDDEEDEPIKGGGNT